MATQRKIWRSKFVLPVATAVGAGLLLSGCMTGPPGNGKVRFVKSADVAHCKFLGKVQGSAHMDPNFQRAMSDLANQAEKMGATDVVMDKGNGTSIGPYSKSEVSGKAYLCPEGVTSASK